MREYEDIANRSLDELARNFPGMNLKHERLIKLGEEAGEVAGAALRCMDMTRRTGDLEELGEELADVVMVSQCIALLFGIDLDKAIQDKAAKVFARGFRDRRKNTLNNETPTNER